MEVLVDEESIRFAPETLNGAWEWEYLSVTWKLELLYKMVYQSIDEIYTSKIAVTRCFDFDDSLMQDDYWYVEIVRAGSMSSLREMEIAAATSRSQTFKLIVVND